MKKHPYLYEIPVFFALLFGVNRFLLPQFPGFIGVDPHPYWIGILLFGFRYGVIAGLISGVLSALLYLYSAWVFLERYLFEDITFYILPSFFILVGVLVGVGVRRYQATLDRQTKEKQALEQTEKLLTDEIQTLKEIHVGLEKKVVTRMATIITLYEGARRLESVYLEELYGAILEFITKTLDAEKSALYLKEGDVLQVKGKIGWQDYEKRPEVIHWNEGVIGLAAASNKVVTVRDFLRPGEKQKSALLGDAVIAGPLRNGETGDVVGVMSVQSISFLNFNSATINLFSFLLNWASRSIGRANYIRELKAHEIIDPEYQLYSHSYFISRVEQELSRSKTYYLPLSVGFVKVDGLQGLPKNKTAPILTALSQLVKSSCREMDVVAKQDDPNIPFAFLLITGSAGLASEIRFHILEHFKKLKLDFISLQVGVASFTPKTKDVESLMQEAKQDIK